MLRVVVDNNIYNNINNDTVHRFVTYIIIIII